MNPNIIRSLYNIFHNVNLKPNAQTEFQGDLAVRGSLSTLALATPGAPTITNVGTAGATTYTYKVVATVNSRETAASAGGDTATGNATLDGTNYNTVAWTRVPGATGYKIYRTVGGATQGLIATITSGATLSVNDTGLAGGGETAPSTNNTGIYSSAGGISLTNADVTGVKDVYGSASANHNLYANAAVTDATERSITLYALNATGDAWLAMITLMPSGAAPTMDFNSRPVSNLTLGGAMNANSQNLGTIGTVTLGGTVTGNNQTVNALGHIGIGNTASSTTIAAIYTATLDAIDAARAGADIGITLTGNPTNNSVNGIQVDITNKCGTASSGVYTGGSFSSWQWAGVSLTASPLGLVGVGASAYKYLNNSGTITGVASFYAGIWGNEVNDLGVVTNAYAFYAKAPALTGLVTNTYGIYINNTGGAKATNAYGIYIANITGAATLNYAIYSAGGQVYLAGATGIGTTPYATQPTGSLGVAGGVMIGANSLNNLIDDASNGAGSTVMYIGTNTIDTTVPSDERLKSILGRTALKALSLIRRIAFVDYEWKDLERGAGRQFGWTAQQVYSVLPEVVITDSIWYVQPNRLVPYVVKAVQELSDRIDCLEAQVTAIS